MAKKQAIAGAPRRLETDKKYRKRVRAVMPLVPLFGWARLAILCSVSEKTLRQDAAQLKAAAPRDNAAAQQVRPHKTTA